MVCALAALAALRADPDIYCEAPGVTEAEAAALAGLLPSARILSAMPQADGEDDPLFVCTDDQADRLRALGRRPLLYRLPGLTGARPAPPGPTGMAPVKRVTLMGAESTGKTTLAGRLARRFGTLAAPEFGRLHTETFGPEFDLEAAIDIIDGHRAGARAAGRYANRVLIEDTDPLLTAVWCDFAGTPRPPEMKSFSDYADLYLLCEADAPWVADGVRIFSSRTERLRFQSALVEEMQTRGIAFLSLKGPIETRFDRATQAISALLDG
jgi:nicotinamide riboside kinase